MFAFEMSSRSTNKLFPESWPQQWRMIRSLLIVAGVLSVVPALYLVERIRGWAAWESYEYEARQRGVKLELSDYIPAEVPAAENFATIPVFDAAFRASEANQPVPNPFKLPEPKGGKTPELDEPVKQRPINLVEWQRFFVEAKMLPAASESAAADVIAALKNFADPLAQLREAGTRPSCRFPVRWEKAYAAQLPHIELLRSASKLYALQVSAHLALGDSPAAYESFREGMRLTTATSAEPTLIAGLVRIASTALMQDAVWGGLARRQWAERELGKIEADLAALDWLRDYAFAMGSERAGTNLMLDIIISRPKQFQDVVPPGDTALRNVFRMYPTGWFYQNKVRSNRFMDELTARVDPAARRFFSERPVPSSPGQISGTLERLYFVFFGITAPLLEDVEKRFVRAATVTDQTRLSCALERFRLARGNFPDDLTALVPEFIEELPAEIVNGEPYRYRQTKEGGFLLYSVGVDLVDDGGVIDPKVKASKQSDWVWQYPAL